MIINYHLERYEYDWKVTERKIKCKIFKIEYLKDEF